MFKKMLVLIMASMLVFSIALPSLEVDAKGTYKSPRKSFTPTTPQKAPTDNVTRNQPGSPTTKTPGVTTPNTNRGFFSGGIMKGLLIGGLAGMLFGGMFGGMGNFGNILGFLVNILAIYFLFVIIKSIVIYFINRKKLNDQKRY
jgi:predicted lipid-binding transport protein (Tim44 family)